MHSLRFMSFRLTTLAETSSLFSGPCKTAEDGAESSLMKYIFFFCGPFSCPPSADSHMPCSQVPIIFSSFSLNQLSHHCTEKVFLYNGGTGRGYPREFNSLGYHRTILGPSQTADSCPIKILFLMKYLIDLFPERKK